MIAMNASYIAQHIARLFVQRMKLNQQSHIANMYLRKERVVLLAHHIICPAKLKSAFAQFMRRPVCIMLAQIIARAEQCQHLTFQVYRRDFV
jgi:hypothetical protein